MRNYGANMMNPSNTKPGHQYCRVFSGNYGYEITEAKMMGWEVVSGDDPEDVEHRAPDGTRVIGDTVLMRITNTQREEIKAYKDELDQRLSGEAEDEKFDEMVRSKGMTPFNFSSREQLKEIIDKKGGK